MTNHNENSSKYVFNGLADAVIYLIISVIYPVYSIVLEYYNLWINKNGIDRYVFFGLIIGTVFFYATYAYDFANKFNDAEEKKHVVYKFLLTCAVIYTFLTIISFLFLIFIFQTSEDISKLFNWILGFFIVTSIPCLYPIFEIVDRIKAKYNGKISKAAV